MPHKRAARLATPGLGRATGTPVSPERPHKWVPVVHGGQCCGFQTAKRVVILNPYREKAQAEGEAPPASRTRSHARMKDELKQGLQIASIGPPHGNTVWKRCLSVSRMCLTPGALRANLEVVVPASPRSTHASPHRSHESVERLPDWETEMPANSNELLSSVCDCFGPLLRKEPILAKLARRVRASAATENSARSAARMEPTDGGRPKMTNERTRALDDTFSAAMSRIGSAQ